ncbi:hypothetical protein EDB87DRAFT_1688992 [Lactarius vividus]|nr:hypothetical protein EDB87DRAFT_1688992 [Lactarius vividus]
MMVKFVLLRSPLAALHDPETVVVRRKHRFVNIDILDNLIHAPEMLSANPSLSEILWNFSRYKDRARITLEQNPHFYSNLPADESVYTHTFKLHPLVDLSTALKPHDTIYVLIDRPGRVFLETEGGIRRFGNVWMLNGALIFKDSSGVLEGEELVRGTIIRGNWQRYEEPMVFPKCECRPRLTPNRLRPIMTTPSADPASGAAFDDWAILSHPSSHSINVQIYSTQGRLGYTMDPDLPPPPPTSEEPEYQVLYTSINTLNDDVLLSIFSHNLPAGTRNNRKPLLGWFELTHVCRRWRRLIYDSAFHLDVHILCAKGAPVVDMLSLLPPLPLVIDYQFITVRVQDVLEISHALRLRNRVRRVSLRIPPSNLQELLVLLEEPFPRLEYLSLSSTFDGDITLTLPKTFLAPNLHHLKLLGVNFSSKLPPSSFTDSLLEELSIDFSNPSLRPSAGSELLDALETPVTLLKLKRFRFRGMRAYLESLIAQIRAPHLEQLNLELNITLFDQVAFAFPHLSHFANTTEGLKLPEAEIIFESDAVAVVLDHHRLQPDDQPPSFRLRVTCDGFGCQIDRAAQICSALMPMLSGAEQLALIERRMYAWHSDTDALSTKWHKLLRPFIGVKMLHICCLLWQEVACALQADDAGLDPGFLPSLQELVPDISNGYTNSSFTQFIHTRQIAGRPVYLSECSLLSPVHPRQLDLEMEALRVPQFRLRPYRSSSYRQRLRTANPLYTLSPLYASLLQIPPVQSNRYLPVPYVPPVQVERDPPPPFHTARPVRGSVKTQPPPPKHIRGRTHRAHKGARSAWR